LSSSISTTSIYGSRGAVRREPFVDELVDEAVVAVLVDDNLTAYFFVTY
jgi:hypothetical protein